MAGTALTRRRFFGFLAAAPIATPALVSAAAAAASSGHVGALYGGARVVGMRHVHAPAGSVSGIYCDDAFMARMKHLEAMSSDGRLGTLEERARPQIEAPELVEIVVDDVEVEAVFPLDGPDVLAHDCARFVAPV